MKKIKSWFSKILFRLIQFLSLKLPYKWRGQLQDGHNSYLQLYELRSAYNACLFNEWSKTGKYEVRKCRRHYSGRQLPNGKWEVVDISNDHFMVYAITGGGVISSHYHMDKWNMFQIRQVHNPTFTWDQHKADDLIYRLKLIAVVGAIKPNPNESAKRIARRRKRKKS
jgi:hypothetical protein